MNQDRWFLLILILIFVSLAVYYLRPGWEVLLSGKETASAAVAPSPSQSLQGGTAQDFEESSVKIKVLDAAHTPWGRNPFLTEEEAKGRGWEGEHLQIKAIIAGQPRSVAAIDGRPVVVGEEVGEEKVWEIRPDAVVLERNRRKRMLRVSQPSISIEVKEGRK